MKVFNIAEKPSVARGISEILSRGGASKRTSASPHNPVFEFPFTLLGRECTMVVSSVTGHLMEYDVHPSYRSWTACDPEELFRCPVVKSIGDGRRPLEALLRREARGADALVLWLDCDREGESIAFEVLEVCLQEARQGVAVHRAHFSAITPAEIWGACASLTPPNRLLADAVDARQEIDLRIGAAFTRWQTLRLRGHLPSLSSHTISYGSCQFPTLGFVVDRFLAVQNFEPEPYWHILLSFDPNLSASASSSTSSSTSSSSSGDFPCGKRSTYKLIQFRWHRGRLFDRLACYVLYERCLEERQARVVNVVQKETRKWRPLPLTTITLQKLAVRKLRLSAHQTMEVAEKLYTNGYISYPRTETDQFPDSLNLPALVALQASDPRWGPFVAQLQAGGFQTPKRGRNNDNSHPPIHPTKPGGALSGDKPRVYELVARHFLACCSRDALGHQTTVDAEVRGELFTAKGLVVLERNYLEVYVYEQWAESELPPLSMGQAFVPSALEMVEGRTQAPPLLTEADLISLMDQNGIGTDATIAQHIETILKREYVFKDHDRFVPSTLGIALVQGYSRMAFELQEQLSKPYLRARMEADMKAVAQGQISKQAMLKRNIDMYYLIFMRVTRSFRSLQQSVDQYMR